MPDLPHQGKKHIKNLSLFILRPFMLAFYVWLLIIYIAPQTFQKYKAEIIDSQTTGSNYLEYYHDLDSDGQSEKIISLINKGADAPAISYYTENLKIINQWNVRGTWLSSHQLFFGDYNNNGFTEVYCITRVMDSLFLNAKELLLNNGLEVDGKFIGKSKFFNSNQTDPYVSDARVMDTNLDNLKEFVFIINSGFSLQPRNIFAYDIENDSITVSPKSASGIYSWVNYMDINDDGVEEITGSVAAVNNNHYNTPYTDSSAWLMVFNPKDQLNFLFPPIEYKGKFGGISACFIKAGKQKYIVSNYACNTHEYSSNGHLIQLFTTNGRLIKEKLLPAQEFGNMLIVNSPINDDNSFYLIDIDGSVYSSDTSLNIEKVSTPDIDNLNLIYRPIESMDADGDGKNEFLFISQFPKPNKLVIYQSSFNASTVVDLLGVDPIDNFHATLQQTEIGTSPIIALQVDNMIYHISYGKSTYSWLKYPVFLGIYLLLLLVFWGLQRAQNKLAQNKFETEKRLIRQQLTISKNQLEPHFMLNTLNNIGYMFANENQEKAQYYFGKFAALIRRGLTYADKTETSLKEELEFVRDYLILQERRYTDLSFSIEKQDGIDLGKIRIPHSLVYTFVENALKHGLFHKKGSKKLIIQVICINKKTEIIIKDNGIGRKRSAELKTMGTGKGIHIVNSIIDGYNNLYYSSISYITTDLVNSKGENAGTEIKVKI